MTNLPSGFVVVRTRARPMSPEERRAHIIDAVIPLLRERGRAVSSREMAEAAGVAEGTLFRAFGDKDSLIAAAIEHYFDPEPFRDALRGIDPDEPTVDKIRKIADLLRERFLGVIGFMSVLRQDGPPPRRERPEDAEWLDIVERMFRPGELSVPAKTLGHYLRILAFASAIPPLNEPHSFSTDELVELVTRGVLPAAPSATAPTGKKD